MIKYNRSSCASDGILVNKHLLWLLAPEKGCGYLIENNCFGTVIELKMDKNPIFYNLIRSSLHPPRLRKRLSKCAFNYKSPSVAPKES